MGVDILVAKETKQNNARDMGEQTEQKVLLFFFGGGHVPCAAEEMFADVQFTDIYKQLSRIVIWNSKQSCISGTKLIG